MSFSVRILRTLCFSTSLVPQTLWSQGAYRLEIISALRPKGLGDETTLVQLVTFSCGIECMISKNHLQSFSSPC